MGLLGQRDRQPEVMDQPGLELGQHELALAGLSRINFFSATAGSYLRLLRGLSSPLRILDIACGGGDVVRRLAKYSVSHALGWHVAGCDLSPVAVEHARRLASAEKVAVDYFVHDALAGPTPGEYDAIICSLFLHHLEQPQAVRLLELMAEAKGVRAIFISDLNRSLLGFALAHAACRLLSASPVVHTDGPLSVRAAFTPSEAAALAERAGLPRGDGPPLLAVPLDADVEARMTLAPTLSLEEAAGRTWPVVVVGAGPAGAVAAGLIARVGSRVLLVDRSTFPRAKVCGCCLNGRALSALADAGLADLPRRLGAVPLTAFRLAAGGREAALRLDQGVSVSREAFDAELVRHAIECGADFLPATRAVRSARPPDRTRSLILSQQNLENEIAARVVVAADGLGGGLLAEGRPAPIRAGSRIGAGVVVGSAPAFYTAGTIFMATGATGYVGLVRLESGALDIACALDPGAVRASGGPGAVAAGILAGVGWPVPDRLDDEAWRGTAPLTRRARRVSGHRVFGLGDATGYVEPFTGEGMAWAMSSAVALAPIALAAADEWRPGVMSLWQRTHRSVVTRRQRVCRVAAEVLRRPWLAALAVRCLERLPALGRPVVRHLNSSAVPALHSGVVR